MMNFYVMIIEKLDRNRDEGLGVENPGGNEYNLNKEVGANENDW